MIVFSPPARGDRGDLDAGEPKTTGEHETIGYMATMFATLP